MALWWRLGERDMSATSSEGDFLGRSSQEASLGLRPQGEECISRGTVEGELGPAEEASEMVHAQDDFSPLAGVVGNKRHGVAIMPLSVLYMPNLSMLAACCFGGRWCCWDGRCL